MMIYEIRTYDLRAGTLPEALKRFEDAYQHRTQYSALSAFFYTEIGPLNQIIHIWPYADGNERDSVRKAAAADSNWPPKVGEFAIKMQSEIFQPLAMVDPFPSGQWGPIYEMRTYTLQPGSIKQSVERWESKIGERTALSPCVGVLHSENGLLNQFVHVWGYKDLNQRMAVRKQAKEQGAWPPPGGTNVVTQANKIMLPANFSPMQ